jgi:MerR family transcriptional regulator, redox-sensitive transcriptional activator SoxR
MIGDVARRAGVEPSAIRYYERIGLLPEAERVSGRRRYDESVFDRLAAIDVAQRAGFTLAEVRTLMSGFSESAPPSERWRRMAQRKLPEVEALIERAVLVRAWLEAASDCRCPTLDDCALFER